MAYPLLASSMWGFSVATSLHAMRLICSGIFDRHPRLKIILGHLGEGIPYFLWRMDNRWLKEKDVQGMGKSDPITSGLKKLPSQYVKENIYVTTSGMFWAPVLQFVNSVLGADRILFAADYPQESALEAAKFIDSVPLSGSDKEKICHLNAENLFKL
jgi:predicted TIM-barrel fold metal-dependent hydrolase